MNVDLRPGLSEHLEMLYRFAIGITRDRDLAADLVQDTMVKAIEQGHKVRDPDALGGWLRRVLHNLAIDRARRSSREIPVDEVEELWCDDAYTVDPEATALVGERKEELEDALSRIPFIYRTVVLLHDAEGWKVREIADLLGVGIPAAKQRLRRGRMALVTALAEGRERRVLLEGVPMRCWDARKHVSDFLDGTLDVATRGVVTAHLETCPTCPPLYAALVQTHERLGDLRDPDTVIPDSVSDRIVRLIEE